MNQTSNLQDSQPKSKSGRKIGRFSFYFSDKIGESAYGELFKGLDTLNNAPVTIEVIQKSILTDQDTCNLLTNKIEIMKKLTHPNIVKLYEVLQTSNNVYIVQEFCDEGDLASFIDSRGGRLAESLATSFLADMIKGYTELHKNNIVLRQLDTKGVRVHEGRLKLADFSFAQTSAGAQEIRPTATKSCLFLAPQILRGETYTSKCDVWSLGVAAFVMVFGNSSSLADLYYNMCQRTELKNLVIPRMHLSIEFTDFLQRALKDREEERISWEEMLLHPIFNSGISSAASQTGMFSASSYGMNLESSSSSSSSVIIPKIEAEDTRMVNEA